MTPLIVAGTVLVVLVALLHALVKRHLDKEES